VHAATAIRDRAERQAGHRIVASDVQINRGTGETVGTSPLAEYIPNDALGLPGRKTLREVFRIFAGIPSDLEGFDCQHRRSGMMTMTTAARWYWKACDDNVRSEFADNADDIREDLFTIPELQRFLG
jgi:hypothetical protein